VDGRIHPEAVVDAKRIGSRAGPWTFNACLGSQGSLQAGSKSFARSNTSERAIRASRRASGPKAEVDSVPECEVRVGIALDVEALGLRKLSGVPVRSPDHREH
jgi:hypothetical protein